MTLESGVLSGLPVIGEVLSKEWGVSVPLFGIPSWDFDIADFYIGETFDYVAFKLEIANLLGQDPAAIIGTVNVGGVLLTFDDDEQSVSVVVGASVSAYAESSIDASVDFYCREVEEGEDFPSLSEYLAGTFGNLVDFASSQVFTSDTGSVTFGDDNEIYMTTGSPVWFSILLTVTDETNVLFFDTLFDSEDLGEGLLSVYWDGELIALIDERELDGGLESYFFSLPEEVEPGEYLLSFRMDPYDEESASVLIDNIYTMNVAAPIPEPGTVAMIAMGALGVCGVIRHRLK